MCCAHQGKLRTELTCQEHPWTLGASPRRHLKRTGVHHPYVREVGVRGLCVGGWGDVHGITTTVLPAQGTVTTETTTVFSVETEDTHGGPLLGQIKDGGSHGSIKCAGSPRGIQRGTGTGRGEGPQSDAGHTASNAIHHMQGPGGIQRAGTAGRHIHCPPQQPMMP